MSIQVTHLLRSTVGHIQVFWLQCPFPPIPPCKPYHLSKSSQLEHAPGKAPVVWVLLILVSMYFEAFILDYLNCFAFSCTYKEMANEGHERIELAHSIEYAAFHPSCKLGVHRKLWVGWFLCKEELFSSIIEGDQRGPEKEKKWKHSPGITCPKTREESDYFSIWSFSADLSEKRNFL